MRRCNNCNRVHSAKSVFCSKKCKEDSVRLDAIRKKIKNEEMRVDKAEEPDSYSYKSVMMPKRLEGWLAESSASQCKRCGGAISWEGWVEGSGPNNLDGSKHKCQKRKPPLVKPDLDEIMEEALR